MKRLDRNIEGFVQYGVSSDLAAICANADLTVTKARTLAIKDLVDKFALSTSQAKAIKEAVSRKPIDKDTLYTLLERSNYLCNICKGTKSTSFIVHHIEPYAQTQDNDYRNLIVLCPADHDYAHSGGLSLSISPAQLLRAKDKWEDEVERGNAIRAAKLVEVNESAIDYMNVKRIEELCLQVTGKIPETRASGGLQASGILNAAGSFQQKFVRDNLSSGRFLFDYINSGEALHYRDLMSSIAQKIELEDLSEAVDRGKKAVVALEGKYAFFIGGVYSSRPVTPFTNDTPMVVMHYTKRKIRVEWLLDPNYLFSVSAIGRQGSKNRYIIYCLVRTVDTEAVPGEVLIKASPLLIAQPSVYANRIPGIGWQSRYGAEFDDELADAAGEEAV
jgi:hypothetical protein